MKYVFGTLLLILMFGSASAQVSAKVMTASGTPVSFAGVTLLAASDSTIVKSAVTDNTGGFKIETADRGSYILKISSAGYEQFTSPAFQITDSLQAKNFGNIILQESIKQLNEVVIRADKPLLQQEAGGITVNVQSSLLTKGSSVLQVLQRAPGVNINPNTNSISLNGKSGVMVMIDGKLMRMSLTQVFSLLNGMSGDEIDKIELLNTPPAKYDADGNAGLINIVTKKNKRKGTNGSATASAGYGRHEKASANVSLNHNTGKINLHGSYSFSHEHGYGVLLAGGTENSPALGGQTAFHYTGVGNPVSNYHNAAAGIDINAGAKTTIGGNIYYSFGRDDNHSNNYGHYALKPDSDLLFNSMLHGINNSRNLINSFYFENELSKGEKLNFAADYIYYKNNGPTQVQSSFIDSNGSEAGKNDSLYAPQQRDLANTVIKVSVAKIDYVKQFNSKLKLEAGAKGSLTRTNSASGIENYVDGRWVLSTVGVSNNLATKELIGAAYGTLTTQIDSLTTLIAGARYEYSHNSTENASNAQYAIDRKLGKLFPSVFFTRKLNSNSELQLSYTKRITRPSFSDLASYVTYNDPISVFTGNPALKPTITNNLKVAYNHHNYLFSLVFSRDNNIILGTQISTGPSKGLVYLAPQNAPYQNNLVLQASIPVKIGGWLESSYSFFTGVHNYKVDYTPHTFEKTYFDYSFNFSETLRLQKNFALEISGNYNSSAYGATSHSYGNGMLNFGIKKDLSNNSGTIQLSISDLLMTATYSSYIGSLTTDAFNSQVFVRYNSESRSFPIVKLTYYRSFGTASNKLTRKDDASRDERNRL